MYLDARGFGMIGVMTLEQIAELARSYILEQGFKPSANEKAGSSITVRALTMDGAAVGSVSLPPHLVEWPEDAIKASVKAAVLDTCRVAANEPALRQELLSKQG